jgi:mannose-6-phosphate isomerase
MSPSSSAQALKAFKARPVPVPLDCGVQNYDWGEKGSGAYIPRLLGVSPEPGKTYAELWIGDHPVKPARLDRPGLSVELPDLIRAAPDEVLGARFRKRFGDRLPFLMKVLAAGKALSIQAHPTKIQAEEGFAREEAAGIPRNDPRRNYRDDNHKPEILVALTPFHGLNGFRPLEEIADAFEMETPELKPLMPDILDRLAQAETSEARRGVLKELYERCMTLPQSEVNALLTPLLQRLENDPAAPFAEDRREHWVLRADADYSRGPDKDRGLFSIYWLNLVLLAPGRAMFLDAGELHAYLRGVGVEVMANSDNVLRGGLTPKHVDVPELLRTLTFEDGLPEILGPGSEGVYRTSAPEFEVAVHRLAAGGALDRPSQRGPDVLLSTEGEASVRSAWGEAPLGPPRPVLVPAGAGAYKVLAKGKAVVYRSSVPEL